MTARFITAPDKLYDVDRYGILIVDAEWHDIESLAIFSMTRKMDIDFYLFGPTSTPGDWIDKVSDIADVILVNYDSDRHIEIKEKLAKNNTVISMGTNNDEHNVPLDYIIKKEVK